MPRRSSPPSRLSLTLLIDDLKRDEGFSSHAYRDSADEGYLTIGYGRMVDRRLGGGITGAEADLLLRNDISEALMGLRSRVVWFDDLPGPVQRALVNMAFNMGVPRLMGFQKMWAALGDRDYQTVADEALDSKWAQQVGPRATRIAALMRSA